MIPSLLDLLFGCSHKRTTFPLSRRKHGILCAPYIVCLECGREFPYDWEEMKVVKAQEGTAVHQERRAQA